MQRIYIIQRWLPDDDPTRARLSRNIRCALRFVLADRHVVLNVSMPFAATWLFDLMTARQRCDLSSVAGLFPNAARSPERFAVDRGRAFDPPADFRADEIIADWAVPPRRNRRCPGRHRTS
ncbi:MAG: hypothetical protein KGJ78_00130 [Alphaproteobacteria bacterium]|nr:hypothetical protein [Alphaproteobacteria bacterium]